MNTVILGSGLLGVTTAYELAKRGHKVTVIDRQPKAGAECSYSNGGQLSYSHCEPWATPHVLPKIPKWMFKDDAPLIMKPRADMDMARWVLQFLRNCTSQRARINCVNMLRLGMYSRQKLDELIADTQIAFDHNPVGILHIHGSEKDFAHGKAQNDFQSKFGCKQNILSRDEVLALEPSLTKTAYPIVGGMHAVTDASADAFKYCNALSEYIRSTYGVNFEYGVTIKGLKTENETIVAVQTDKGDMVGDQYVMALGSHSAPMLRSIGLSVPVYPMKGYSITMAADEHCPNISVTDIKHKIVFTRLGDRLRVAGTAEFAAYDDSVNDVRIKQMVDLVKYLFPDVDTSGEISKWACLRPSTPDGPPILGLSTYHNLFLNIGHGTLGWTQCNGSAAIVADIMEGRTAEILMQGMTLERYL